MTAFGEAVVALLLLGSGALVVVAAVGMLRLRDFFSRMHAPALAYTLGSWLVALACIVHFSMHEGGLALQAGLIIVLLAITAPVTTALLARAAVFRGRAAGEALPPPLATQAPAEPPSYPR